MYLYQSGVQFVGIRGDRKNLSTENGSGLNLPRNNSSTNAFLIIPVVLSFSRSSLIGPNLGLVKEAASTSESQETNGSNFVKIRSESLLGKYMCKAIRLHES